MPIQKVELDFDSDFQKMIEAKIRAKVKEKVLSSVDPIVSEIVLGISRTMEINTCGDKVTFVISHEN